MLMKSISIQRVLGRGILTIRAPRFPDLYVIIQAVEIYHKYLHVKDDLPSTIPLRHTLQAVLQELV